MRENENEHEGQTPEYISPWAPRPSASREPDGDGDDDLPPYYAGEYPDYASDYPAAPDSPTIPARPVNPNPNPSPNPTPDRAPAPDTPTIPNWQPQQGPQTDRPQQYQQHQQYPQHQPGQGYQPSRGYHRGGDRAEAENDTIAFGNPSQHHDYWPPQPPQGPEANLYGPRNPYGGDEYAQAAPPEPAPPRPRASRMLIYLAVAVVAASIGAAATVAINHGGTAAPVAGSGVAQNGIPAQHNNASGSGGGANLNTRSVERKVKPGLVDIVSTLSYNNETAEGTGMILSSNGLVLTNNHVINQSTSITVSLVDGGQTYPAKVVGYDASADVALLRLEDASGLPTVTLGNSSQVSVGTPVLALGNAEGRGGVTPAEGIINALNRSINASDQGSGGTENLHNMLQTSAQIVEGDSGGALANNAGQIVGMITAANTSSDQPGGTVGFAIPINTARSIALQIASGSASSTVYIGTPGFLGIILPQSSSADPQQQARDEQNYLEQNDQGTGGDVGNCIQNDAQLAAPGNVAPVRSGVLIVGVFCGTAVNAAGLVPGDVVTSVNGSRVTTADGLRAATAAYHPGHAIRLGWTDLNGGRHVASVTLGSGPVR